MQPFTMEDHARIVDIIGRLAMHSTPPEGDMPPELTAKMDERLKALMAQMEGSEPKEFFDRQPDAVMGFVQALWEAGGGFLTQQLEGNEEHAFLNVFFLARMLHEAREELGIEKAQAALMAELDEEAEATLEEHPELTMDEACRLVVSTSPKYRELKTMHEGFLRQGGVRYA